MKKVLPILLLFFSSCFLFEDEKDKDKQNTNLTLSLHSAGVTTVNLNVNPEDSLAQFTFELTRDDSTVQTLSIQSDTLIKDTGLNPNTTYTYKGYWINGTERIGESETLTVTTMDTTSHNFTWEIDTLGIYGSYLNDVWIVDENNIWVVGLIVLPDPDSSHNGTGRENYNAAHWDGNEWEFIKVMPPGGYVTPVRCIYYFNDNDIWFGKGGLPIHWDGEEFFQYHPGNSSHPGQPSIEAIWGTSSNNIYFVGHDGSIVYYNGVEFQEMESGTDIKLKNISGSPNGDNIYVTGFNDSDEWGGYSIALSYKGEWNTLREENHFYPTYGSDEFGLISSVWCTADTAYFMTYSGLRTYSIITNEERLKINRYSMGASDRHIIKFSGNSLNDIIFVGSFGHLIHFNGFSWRQMFGLNNQYPNGQLSIWGMDYNENLVVAVGDLFDYEKAVIVKGKRE